MTEEFSHKRNSSLDIVRFVAIILVLFRHASLPMSLSDIGWVGVDLFFILSGFLVSGLLFSELKKRGTVRLGRFLARRALKIYPMFYIFIVVSIVFRYFFAVNPVTDEKILSEIFFLQSYFPGLWDHTWSLAVEEHFYLFLALIVLLLYKLQLIHNLKVTLLFLLGIFIIPLILRFILIYQTEGIQYIFHSHLRMDSLFLGVLLSFLMHFFVDFNIAVNSNRLFCIIVGMLLSCIVFFYPAGSVEMNTWAGLIMNVGFGLIVLFAASESQTLNYKPNFITNTMAIIGKYSYGIYLWHLFVKAVFMHLSADYWQWSYMFVSIPIGIGISTLVETPVLKWRDKKFP